MTPSARVQASIELLESILTAWQEKKRFPADKLLEQYFKSRRYIGSKDRGSIAELIYWILRHKATLGWWLEKYSASETARMYIISALALRNDIEKILVKEIFDGSKYSPERLDKKESELLNNLTGKQLLHKEMPEHIRLNYPDWLGQHLSERFGDNLEAEMLAMNEQTGTDIRANTLKINRDDLLQKLKNEGFDCSPTPLSPLGIRLKKRAPIFTSKYFKEGMFEVQDEGSQLIAIIADAKPSMRIIDFCAGAGGKTLAMAAAMENKGRILAWDTSKKRLDQINIRLRRASIHNVQTHVIESEHDAFIKRHKLSADRVLIDVPCSGSGTWRRNPDLKWRFNIDDLQEIIKIQQEILQSASRLVKDGGRLIYATCSLLREENEMQIEHFLKTNNHFKVVPIKKIWNKYPPADNAYDYEYLSLTPHQDGTDGFFAAVMEKLPA